MEASPGGAWGPNEPEPLFEILLQYCASHLHTFSAFDEQQEQYVLHPGVSLPSQVGERLLQGLITEEKEEVDKYLWMFSDPQRCLLRSLNLSDAILNPESFLALLRQRLVDLDLTRCKTLNDECIRQLRSKAPDLRRLILGESLTQATVPSHTSPNWISSCSAKVAQNITSEVDEEPSDLYDSATVSGPQWPRLQALTVTHTEPEHLAHLNLPSLRTLTYLDLSRCKVKAELMSSIEDLPSLYTLILYNVPLVCNVTKSITRLKQLRSLDLSRSKNTSNLGNVDFHFPNPTSTLLALVKGLPMLRRLDISGTNLTQERIVEEGMDEETRVRSIAGLSDIRLDFLGLQDCFDNPCSWEMLPAEQVTGDNDEDQVILATQLYRDKEELLISALNNLFSIFRYSTCTNQKLALDAILAGMDRHPYNKRVQITGSASLFYIVKGEENKRLTFKLKRHIIATVLTAMENHMGESTMMHNGCLTLCHFSIPQDMMFVYTRLVKLLLAMVKRDEQDDFLQRIGIYLINGLACQVEAREKRLLGDLGAISSMLHIIRQRLSNHLCDEVMEIAWGAMWNVTDETDINCNRFIDGEGMDYFLKCWEVFPDRPELLKNMMGLMGNVAEVAALRQRLMKQEYVHVFCELLRYSNDGIEISYNACGVLAHMLSDGPQAWSATQPNYRETAELMVQAIQGWSIRTKRFINYRSFKPILRLLVSFISPEAQYWAVWALCNLTTMYPNKYCLLVESDGGFPLLQEVAKNPRALPDAQQLAKQVLYLCECFKQNPHSITYPSEEMISDGED